VKNLTYLNFFSRFAAKLQIKRFIYDYQNSKFFMMKRFIFMTLLLFAGMSWMAAQTTLVTGKVTSAENDEPIIGASVSVKGSTVGVATSYDGSFSLSVPANTKTVMVSYLGMVTQEVSVGQNLRISLVTDTRQIDEVVVTAMNLTREKKALGYGTQEVKGEQLTQAAQTDLNNAVAGKVAGVRFWGASGATFDAGTIILRGTSSLTDSRGGAPIYVVDGVITNVNAVNMDDVESINVLKGPAATALYGSRGGNGAVIITSKKGIPGKAQFDFNQSFSVEQVMMTAKYQSEYGGGNLGADGELLTFHYDPVKYGNYPYLQAMEGKKYYDMDNDMSWGPKFNGEPYAPWYSWDPTDPRFGQTAPWSGQPSDNLKELYKTGFASTTNLAFSKTMDKFKTRISFSNVQRQGVLQNSDAVRRFASINASYDINDRLSITADYRYSYRKNHNPAVEGYGNLQNTIYDYTQWFQRNLDINEMKNNWIRPDGTYRTWNINSLTDLRAAYHDNPFMLQNEINRVSVDQWNLINSTVKFDIIKKKLSIGATLYANLRNHFDETKVPYNITSQTSRYNTGQNDLWDTQVQGFIAYTNRFLNSRLSVDARAFVEERDYDYRELVAATSGGLTSNKYYNLAASVEKPTVTNNETKQKYRSVFATGNAGWVDTYYIDFSLRNDWASTLPNNLNSYLYGSLSVAVLMNNYFKEATWLNLWKLRASLAQVGSTLDPYNIYEPYIIDTKYGNSTTMRMDPNMKNQSIRPTISTSYEVGTEWKMFKNRFYGDVNFYTKDSKDQIINLTVAPTSGYTTAKINAGLIRNRGYEIQLGGSPVKTNDFEWELYGNWSKNVNKLIELDKNNPTNTQYQLTWFSLYSRLYSFAEVGKPIGVIRGSSYNRTPDGQIIYTKKLDAAGNPIYTPSVNMADQKELGNVQPKATGGFGTAFTYKNFRLSMGFDFQIGGQVGSVSNMFGEQSGLLMSTVGKNDRGADIRTGVYDNNGGIKVSGVTNEGTAANPNYVPFTGYVEAQNYFDYKGRIWEPNVFDASFLKMRELAFTYTLPKKVVRSLRAGLSQAKVSLIAQNPWLIYSAIPNVDASSIGNAWSNYIEQGQTFSTRSFGLSINLSF